MDTTSTRNTGPLPAESHFVHYFRRKRSTELPGSVGLIELFNRSIPGSSMRELGPESQATVSPDEVSRCGEIRWRECCVVTG